MFNKLTINLKWLFNLIRCQLFHEKTVRHFRFFDGVLINDAGMYEGCKQCDLWQKIADCHNEVN